MGGSPYAAWSDTSDQVGSPVTSCKGAFPVGVQNTDNITSLKTGETVLCPCTVAFRQQKLHVCGWKITERMVVDTFWDIDLMLRQVRPL
jgi:hypothetical protein